MKTTLGKPLADRVERRLETIARRMVEAFLEEVPIYRMLPREQLDGEILAISRQNLRLFFRCVREGRRPTDAELDEPRASAARRAEEGVPLEAVLSAYHVGGRVGWQAMVEEARTEEDHEELLDLATRVMTYIQGVTSAVASTYVEEQQHIYGEERDARRRLAETLLSPGEPAQAPDPDDVIDIDRDEAPLPSVGVPSPLARRAGVRLAPSYLVLALRIGPSADEQDAGVVAAVAGRRKVRRIQAALDELAGEPVLTLLDPTGGSVLFPLTDEEPAQALGMADGILEAVAKAAEAEVLAGASWRAGAEAAGAAAAEARGVLRIADALGRSPGVYRLDDVLLEYTWANAPRTATQLAGVLEPLASRPDLIETLDAWFASDFDRRAAAAALMVHPNTLDYRLRRIQELTGLELSSARGIQILGAALTARRLQEAEPA
jgi:hypothetical protein